MASGTSRRTAHRTARRTARRVAVAGAVVLCVLAGAAVGVGVLDGRRDAAAADAQASASASVAAQALADDAAAREVAAARASASLAATTRQEARSALLAAVEDGGATLDATDGEVADDAVRDALAQVLQRAKHALESTPQDAEAGEGGSAGGGGPAGEGGSVAALRTLAAEVVAARAAVAASHEEWVAEREARAREAARTPAPPPAGRDPGGSDDDRCRTTYDGPPFYTSPPTKGGDGSNGRLPGSMLAATSWGVDPKGTRYYLRTEATAALERLNVAFRAEFGHDLDLDLTYRDYATQVAMREALGSIAARPGTSKHGTGYALDVPELPCEYGYGTPQHTWLVGTGPSFGWVQPSWARQGGSNPEYWHFEYVG
ncbi:M15 family metallopeptidase [Cellulomonas sp. CW35]|uniref:M15 family metallopeptidase n=1 Tax=Cellulomonas sp. CW35 TaxID=3458249 RepID=UPI0040344BE9